MPRWAAGLQSSAPMASLQRRFTPKLADPPLHATLTPLQRRFGPKPALPLWPRCLQRPSCGRVAGLSHSRPLAFRLLRCLLPCFPCKRLSVFILYVGVLQVSHHLAVRFAVRAVVQRLSRSTRVHSWASGGRGPGFACRARRRRRSLPGHGRACRRSARHLSSVARLSFGARLTFPATGSKAHGAYVLRGEIEYCSGAVIEWPFFPTPAAVWCLPPGLRRPRAPPRSPASRPRLAPPRRPRLR